MALANIIKEVDPPVELTQAEYDALSTAQKNDGTVYYITDGNGAFQTAATTPAEDTSGGTSNVQDELQKKVEKTDVVNNFTTTQEGYVADARALKTIADNYSLKTDLQAKLTAGYFFTDSTKKRLNNSGITTGDQQVLYAANENIYFGNSSTEVSIITGQGNVSFYQICYPIGNQTQDTYCYGWITNNAKQCVLKCIVSKNFWMHWTASVTAATNAYIRTVSGSYLGGSNSTLTSYIASSKCITRSSNMIQLVLENNSGWGITNNTPVIGQIKLTFKVN